MLSRTTPHRNDNEGTELKGKQMHITSMHRKEEFQLCFAPCTSAKTKCRIQQAIQQQNKMGEILTPRGYLSIQQKKLRGSTVWDEDWRRKKDKTPMQVTGGRIAKVLHMLLLCTVPETKA